jgi:hypothetical protein
VRSRTVTVRSIALVCAGSAAVHELRYLIGYGPGASRALAAHPHGYFSVALPGILTATLITLASLVMRAAGSRRDAAERRTSLVALWTAATLLLAAIFAIQETLEGAGAIAHGGWIGLALAVPVGLAVALALRGADAAATLRGRHIELLGFSVRSAHEPSAPRSLHGRKALVRLAARGPPPAFVV